MGSDLLPLKAIHHTNNQVIIPGGKPYKLEECLHSAASEGYRMYFLKNNRNKERRVSTGCLNNKTIPPLQGILTSLLFIILIALPIHKKMKKKQMFVGSRHSLKNVTAL